MTARRAERPTGESSSEQRADDGNENGDGDSENGDGDGENADEQAPIRTVPVSDGRTVAYAEYGAADGTPVVLFHGTPGSHVLGELYHEEARRRGVRLLAVDRPGYGDSAPWPDRTPTDAGEYVRGVLDDAGVSRVGVVAFSGGSVHALALAATCEESVTEVDLVSGATPPSLQSGTPAVVRLLGTLAERTPRLLKGVVRGQAWLARRGPASVVVGQYTSDGGEIPDEAAEVVGRDFVTAVGNRQSGFVTESRLSARDWEEWDFSLDDVRRPVRVWHGGRDANAPVEGARRLADRLPNAEIRLFERDDHLSALLRSRSRILEHHAGSTADGPTGERH